MPTAPAGSDTGHLHARYPGSDLRGSCDLGQVQERDSNSESGVPHQIAWIWLPEFSKWILVALNVPLCELYSYILQDSFCLRWQKSNLVSVNEKTDFLNWKVRGIWFRHSWIQLFQRTSQGSAPHVCALNYAGRKMLWLAGPWPSHWDGTWSESQSGCPRIRRNGSWAGNDSKCHLPQCWYNGAKSLGVNTEAGEILTLPRMVITEGQAAAMLDTRSKSLRWRTCLCPFPWWGTFFPISFLLLQSGELADNQGSDTEQPEFDSWDHSCSS